ALFLEKVRASNLPSTAKTQAGQLVAGAIALSAKVQALEAELAKLRQQRVNETVNQPSSKKPEWDKGNGADPEKPTRKRKLGGPRPGSGNRPKTNPEPGPFGPQSAPAMSEMSGGFDRHAARG